MTNLLLLAGYVPLAATVVVLLVLNRKSSNAADKLNMVDSSPTPLSYNSVEEMKNETARLLQEDESTKDETLCRLRDRACDLLEREKLYLKPDIRIGDIADRLHTNKSYLSQAIKYKANCNFCQLVHQYRVKEAMRIYSTDQSLTIQQLCIRVGFNSMTTFNSAFGRNTGYTPAEWCREYKRRNGEQITTSEVKGDRKNEQESRVVSGNYKGTGRR